MQLFVGLILIVLDQVLKSQLSDSAPINSGIGFGLFSLNADMTTIWVTFFSLLVLVVLAWNWRGLNTVQRLGAAAVVAGALSNLLDRFRVGGVIDPLSVGDWFPHFNLADCSIVAGLAILLVSQMQTTEKPPQPSFSKGGRVRPSPSFIKRG